MNCEKCVYANCCEKYQYARDNEFEICNCKYFKLSDNFKFLKISANPALMRMIYYYFTNNKEKIKLCGGKATIEEIVKEVLEESEDFAYEL